MLYQLDMCSVKHQQYFQTEENSAILYTWWRPLVTASEKHLDL